MEPERNGQRAEPQDATLRRLARLSRAPMIRLRWPWRSLGTLTAFYAVTAATLWGAGVPRWRTAAVAIAWLAQGVGTLRFTRRGAGLVELGAYPPDALRLGILHLATSSVAIALTLGLRSPLLVTLLMPAITSLALFGEARQCRILVAATAACLVALGLLPPAWVGGALPAARFGALAVVSVLAVMAIVGTNVVRVRAALRDSERELATIRGALATQALARARSLEEVGAQVAHELKNPLSAVKALAQLGASGPGAAAARATFAAVDAEVTRMQVILREYLSFTRPMEDLRPERVGLGKLGREVLEALGGEARRARVQLRCRGDARVMADPRHLNEALLNLVANAIAATLPGGGVDVEVGEDGERARVVIRDTGAGMTPDVLARLGTPFFTTRETGTGLGVVLARSVVEQHGGALGFESAPGAGTTVTVTLPLEASRAAAQADPSEPPPPDVVRLQTPREGIAAGAFYQSTLVAAAWLGGLPHAWLAGVAVGSLIHYLPMLRYAVRPAPPSPAGAYPPTALLLLLLHVLGAAVQMSFTGGLGSPFLVGLFAPAIVSLALFDDVWQSRLVIAATLAVLVLAPLVTVGSSEPALSPWAAAFMAGFIAIGIMPLLGMNILQARGLLSASGRELARARDALASHAVARARSLETVGARVARELEQPLAEVGRLAVAGVATASDPRTREWFGVIGREVTRMQGFLAEYLRFARPLQSFRPERVELGPLVADVLTVLSGRAMRAGVLEDSRGDASVAADPSRLKEALLNLVANAIDATPAGGRVDVMVEGQEDHARIAIRDTGRGMAPEVLARVGTPFFTTRETGTGLGVVLARSVFHRHGGGLRFESAPGRGTTVIATLPLHRETRRPHGDRAVG